MKNQTNITSKSPIQSPIQLMCGAFTTCQKSTITITIKNSYTKKGRYSMLSQTQK
jgi:hypothetical protein